MKTDNWTNEEVIEILGGLRLVGRNGVELSEQDGGDWNAALSVAMSQFSDFKKSAREIAVENDIPPLSDDAHRVNLFVASLKNQK